MAGDADLIVIGAGAAGLAAAARLSEAGARVSLLEARARIGGRLLTLRAAGYPLPIELGAEFVHGTSPAIWDVVRAAGLTTIEAGEPDLRAKGGSLTRPPDFWAGLRALVERAERATADHTAAQLLAEFPPGDANVPALGRYLEGFHAARLDRVSAKSIAKAERGAGGSHNGAWRILDGYDAVADALRTYAGAGLDLRLNTHVRAIHWSPGRVQVIATTAGGGAARLEARAAVVTLPVGVLKARGPECPSFDPELDDKRLALAQLEMGVARRVVLRFREIWWEDPRPHEGGPGPVSFIHVPDASLPIWWAPAPLRAPMLTGWAGGPSAERLAGLPVQRLAAAALDALAAAFGRPRDGLDALLLGAYSHDWSADPCACGAYSYVASGGLPAQAELARPVAGTLFFAGEATHTGGEHATVHGAIATGHRAAAEALAALR
ncbi:MAG TPA: NAD(P)/FAD-dependent oxidoreductase [Gemmatimonadales bacterium]|nr:NAD(P)/FAD-dependent oxidoreductase [Gemmatimonadales bacterium]